jgi:hypothetical protein
MKNSLIKCLEHQAREGPATAEDPGMLWTQKPLVAEEASNFFLDDDDFTVFTPVDCRQEPTSEGASSSRENINLLFLYDDGVYVDYLLARLRSKRVRIVDFPS